jgi:hypothetical protein
MDTLPLQYDLLPHDKYISLFSHVGSILLHQMLLKCNYHCLNLLLTNDWHLM